MWTNENRARYDRSALRYPSDLTDAEWALIRMLILLAKRGGNSPECRTRRFTEPTGNSTSRPPIVQGEPVQGGDGPLKLTRFGGALQAFRGGFTDGQDTRAVFA